LGLHFYTSLENKKGIGHEFFSISGKANRQQRKIGLGLRKKYRAKKITFQEIAERHHGMEKFEAQVSDHPG
jgi:hypothetical protein